MVDPEIRHILSTMRTIAVVGLSPKSSRPSNQVAAYLIRAGYAVYPVNPGHDEILGLPCYPDLYSVPVKIDIVDIFRTPKDVPAVVDAALALGAKVVWMQQGAVNQEAAARAQKAGAFVVTDRCIKVDHMNMGFII